MKKILNYGSLFTKLLTFLFFRAQTSNLAHAKAHGLDNRKGGLHRSYPLLLLSGLMFVTETLSATYVVVYSGNANGGITFTGNTLGLDKDYSLNEPGVAGAIGTFTTVNLSSHVNSYPAGTTLDWTVNSSSAVLDLPAGSSVLHAELVWGGSYDFDPTITNNDNLSIPATTNTPVLLTTPIAGPIAITPTLAQSRTQINPSPGGYYVRSADVTSFVAAAGAGTYTVGGVPGTAIATDDASNCAGWTLCVAYSNPMMLTSNLTLFVGCEASGAPPASVTGFHAPDVGTITGRLFVSALEGDAYLTGDQFLVSSSSTLVSPADQVSGTNNPAMNFFASQINTLLPLTTDLTTGKLIASGSSQLDTRGTFGTINSIAATGTQISGARQGYDITSVDLGNKIQNGQTQIYTQGITVGDVYTVNALGLQLQSKAPAIKSTKSASAMVANVGDTITFIITFQNVGELDAQSLLFTDALPPGMTLIANSFSINGTPVANPNLIAGVSLGNLAVNSTKTVVFSVTVQAPQQQSYVNFADVSYTFTPGGSTPLVSQTNTLTIPGPTVTPPVANNNTGTTNANTVLHGTSVLANDTGTSIQVSQYDTTSTQGGTIFMQANGTYTYTPPIGFSGNDSFTYTISDIYHQTSTATVNISVLPQALGETASVASNTLLSAPTVLSNDVGTGLTVIPLANSPSSKGGTVNMQADGSYTYLSPLNFSGTDTFSYIIKDSTGNTATATVIVTVLPVAENDLGTTNTNTTLNGSTVFANDLGSGLVITTYTHSSMQGGTVSMNTTTGTYTYKPPLNFSGTDTFTYTLKDTQGKLSIATVTITVLPVAINDTATGEANAIIHGTSVLTNDKGTGLTATPFSGSTVQGGTITLVANGTYTYQPPVNFSGSDSFTYTAKDWAGHTTTAQVIITVLPIINPVTATTNANTPLVGSTVLASDIGTALTVTSFTNHSTQGGSVSMNANGTYFYTPPLNFSGVDVFSFTAKDSSGNGSTSTVTITVVPIGNPNVFQAWTNIPLDGTSVLNNDIGTGLHVITYDMTSVQGGTISMNGDGTFIYIPQTDFSGNDSFTYTAEDSSGNTFQQTVSITVVIPSVYPPATFLGKLRVCKLLNGNKYSVFLTWTPSPSPSAVAYRIYLAGSLVQEIPSTASLQYKICVPSQSAAYMITITAVDNLGVESPIETVRIIT